MNNKGFAITGIIYTLFILFLTILLSVLAGLNRFQTLVINSTKNLETTYEGKSLDTIEINTIKESGITPYKGKYIFNVTLQDGTILKECISYLDAGINFNTESITMSPSICNNNIQNKELIEIYNFEGEM